MTGILPLLSTRPHMEPWFQVFHLSAGQTELWCRELEKKNGTLCLSSAERDSVELEILFMLYVLATRVTPMGRIMTSLGVGACVKSYF